MLASRPPLSRRARLTLAISATGRVETSFQITMRWESLGRMASTASYISRALVVWPVLWYRIPWPSRACTSLELAFSALW